MTNPRRPRAAIQQMGTGSFRSDEAAEMSRRDRITAATAALAHACAQAEAAAALGWSTAGIDAYTTDLLEHLLELWGPPEPYEPH